MKFDDFWNLMVAELATSKQFTTQSKPFSAKYSGGRIMVSTSDTLWPIDRFSNETDLDKSHVHARKNAIYSSKLFS